MQDTEVTSQGRLDTIKNLTISILTVAFFSLYAAAMLGWLKPLSDVTMISRLEPIIFVIVGYYFGRMPGQQNERALREEIARHVTKSDTALHAKENALRERDMFEEKIRNANAALTTELANPSFSNSDTMSAEIASGAAFGASAANNTASTRVALAALETAHRILTQ